MPLTQRMTKALELLKREKEVATLQGQISTQVNEKVSANQREFFLREQMKVIEKELGISKDDNTSDLDRFQQLLENLHPPQKVQDRIEEEFSKLKVLESGSPEYGVTRNYLDWATSVPWGVYSEDNLNLKQARAALEAHHDGLDDVKARITEVILPFANKGDFEALPDYLREGITVHFVRSFREVFDIVFDASAEQKQLH